MKYMMLVCADDSAEPVPEHDQEGMITGTTDWTAEMGRRGVRLEGSRLHPKEDATTVRVRRGELLIADGAHTNEGDRIVGYDIIECNDLDEAIEVVSKHPMARHGAIDIRPFWQ
jgi:hypothetical protein